MTRSQTEKACLIYEKNVNQYWSALTQVKCDIDSLIDAVQQEGYQIEDIHIDLRQKLDQYQKCSAAFTRYLESGRNIESENQEKVNKTKLHSLETLVDYILKRMNENSTHENVNENGQSSKQNSQSELENTVIRQEISIDNQQLSGDKENGDKPIVKLKDKSPTIKSKTKIKSVRSKISKHNSKKTDSSNVSSM